MPEFSGLVTVDLARKGLSFGGVPFPYYLSEEGPILGDIMNPRGLRSVTITFYARDIEVIPEGPLSVEEAQLRVERAQRDLVDAQQAVRLATEEFATAAADVATAHDEAERLVAEAQA